MKGLKEKGSNSDVFIYIMLGAFTAFAPFVTDMYLPALPALTDAFSATPSEVQTGLTSSMIGLAAGQLIIGPLSDKFGRKPPLCVSLVAFAIASAFCIFSKDIATFVAMRFFQGIGASGGIVLARSIAADLYAGSRLARVMAVIGAINGIAPVISPVVGGLVLSFAPWQSIFVILLVIGIVLIFASMRLCESHPADNRKKMSILQTFGQTKELIANRKFRIYALTQGMAFAVFFAQIAASPFIFQTHYGFSQLGFSLFFSVNALTIGVFAFLSAAKFRSPQTAIAAGSYLLLASACMTALALFLDASVAVFEACLWLMHVSFGLLFAPLTALAMNNAKDQAGMGSAIFGAIGFVTGGIVSPLVGMGSMTVSAGIVFAVCAALTFAVARRSARIEACPAVSETETVSAIQAALSSSVMHAAEERG